MKNEKGPVEKMTSVPVLLALAASQSWKIDVADGREECLFT